jgi:hypothetical protein
MNGQSSRKALTRFDFGRSSEIPLSAMLDPALPDPLKGPVSGLQAGECVSRPRPVPILTLGRGAVYAMIAVVMVGLTGKGPLAAQKIAGIDSHPVTDTETQAQEREKDVTLWICRRTPSKPH